MTQNPTVAAASAFVLYYTDEAVRNIVDAANEPYRCLVDMSRVAGRHNVVDGSADYATMIDALEYLVVTSSTWG